MFLLQKSENFYDLMMNYLRKLKKEIQFMKSIVAQVSADIDNYREQEKASFDALAHLNEILSK